MQYLLVCVACLWDEFEAGSDELAKEELHRRVQSGTYGKPDTVLQPDFWNLLELLRVDRPAVPAKTTPVPKDIIVPDANIYILKGS